MDDIEQEYVYKPRWKPILFGTLFFGGGAVFFGIKASGNDRGVNFHGIEMDPDSATALFWTLCFIDLSFVALAGLIAYHRLTRYQRLAFYPTAMIVPLSRWSFEEREIAYRDINSLTSVQINGQKFLDIHHLNGKLTITGSMLPSNTAFDEVCALLSAKVQTAKLTATEKP